MRIVEIHDRDIVAALVDAAGDSGFRVRGIVRGMVEPKEVVVPCHFGGSISRAAANIENAGMVNITTPGVLVRAVAMADHNVARIGTLNLLVNVQTAVLSVHIDVCELSYSAGILREAVGAPGSIHIDGSVIPGSATHGT
ncbi:MAG: hypothetical protein LBJ46_01845 [Planctomycetota bacterium]|nr:hypothetical protein [Planctomycetota bacterium]